MDYSLQWLSVCGLLCLAASLSFACRCLLLDRLKQVPRSDVPVSVSPAELAYLLRPADSTHCMMVLTVDFLQKGLKSPAALDEELQALDFKQEIWRMVKEYIKTWSEQKSHELLPELKTGSPLRILRGLWRIRLFVLDTIKVFFADIIKDPLQIRKYFSVTGLVRLFVSSLSSNLKTKLGDNLHASLLQKNLLLSSETRQLYANYLNILAVIHLAVCVLICVLVPHQIHWQSMLVLVVSAVANALLWRTIGELRNAIPFYEELALALRSVKREGYRFAIVRFLVWLVQKGVFLACLVTAAFTIGLETLILHQFFILQAVAWYFCTLGILAFSVNFLVMIDSLFESSRLASTDQVTSEGLKVLALCRSRMRNIGPIAALTNTLSDPDYNAQLSEVVAIYGIETLVLLA